MRLSFFLLTVIIKWLDRISYWAQSLAKVLGGDAKSCFPCDRCFLLFVPDFLFSSSSVPLLVIDPNPRAHPR